jgi:hypothetical protein
MGEDPRLREAASQDNAHAQMLLGSNYALGKGVEKDLSEAEAWLRRAADQGDQLAHFQLATVYYEQRRFADAVSVLRPAADRGLPQAQVMLATLYRIGRGVAVDLEESVRWRGWPPAGGNAEAQNNLDTLEDGIADPGEVVVWFDRTPPAVNAQLSLVRPSRVPASSGMPCATSGRDRRDRGFAPARERGTHATRFREIRVQAETADRPAELIDSSPAHLRASPT